MSTNLYPATPSDVSAPAIGFAQLASTSDSVDLTTTARSVYVGATGNIALIGANPNFPTAVTFQNVQAGTILPVMASRILATGTTIAASAIVLLY